MSDDYEVGYKKPPKKYQFRKGQSGNRGGRPKKQKLPEQPVDNSPAAIMKRVSERTVVIEGQEITAFELELRALQAKAIKGDPAASRQLRELRKELGLLVAKPAFRGGVLVVPGQLGEADFAKLAFKQQAPFRERATDYGEKAKGACKDGLG